MTETMAAWQHGYPLEKLQAIRGVFDRWDEGLTLGAFTRVKENRIASWLHAGHLQFAESEGGQFAVVACHTNKQRSTVKDFTGEPRLRAPAGTLVIERFVGTNPTAAGEGLRRLLDLNLYDPVLAHGWLDGDDDRRLLESLGLRLAAVKIRASSELVGVWQRGCEPLDPPLSAADEWSVRAAPSFQFDPAPLLDEVRALDDFWQDHYSGYNKRRSWHALSLRSFGGSPEFIEKPAEMSRGWKEQHPETLEWQPLWTDICARAPRLVALASSVPAELERVRLMRLRANDGQLTRHADITDREAGTADGRIMRLHFPLITNEAVRFASWRLDGSADRVHMPAGTVWYLDVRKPHAAVNLGDSNRVHLVVDAHATPELRAWFS